MARETIDPSAFQPDIREFLALLYRHRVRYLVVGGEAVIYYGHARLTGDMDLFYDRSLDNVTVLHATLRDFWGGNVPEVDRADELLQEGLILQFGVPPNRIDLINRVSGVEFADAWPRRTTALLEDPAGDIHIYYMALDDLIENKRVAGRPKDIEDLRFLRRQRDKT